MLTSLSYLMVALTLIGNQSHIQEEEKKIIITGIIVKYSNDL